MNFIARASMVFGVVIGVTKCVLVLMARTDMVGFIIGACIISVCVAGILETFEPDKPRT